MLYTGRFPLSLSEKKNDREISFVPFFNSSINFKSQVENVHPRKCHFYMPGSRPPPQTWLFRSCKATLLHQLPVCVPVVLLLVGRFQPAPASGWLSSKLPSVLANLALRTQAPVFKAGALCRLCGDHWPHPCSGLL